MEIVFQQPGKCRKQFGEVPTVEGPLQKISRKEVKEDIDIMKKGIAAGCTSLSIYLIKHLGESGVDMMHEILKGVWEEEHMPEEWEKCDIVPTHKTNGDPL